MNEAVELIGSTAKSDYACRLWTQNRYFSANWICRGLNAWLASGKGVVRVKLPAPALL